MNLLLCPLFLLIFTFTTISFWTKHNSHLVYSQLTQRNNMSRHHLDEFLQSTRQQLGTTKKKVIITGNDSADLDSIISSLLFAYLSTILSNSTETTVYIPIVKVPKADLELRPELKFVLDQAHVDYTKLICLDELHRIDPKDTQIILVDHNYLTAPFDQPPWNACQVMGVLDHHVDEKYYLDAPLRNIQMVGSCVTLVLEHFIKQRIDDDNTWLNEHMVRLALAPLLVDTVNLKWELGRTTELDLSIFHVLQRYQHKEEGTMTSSTDNYFKAIEKVKSQVDSMSNPDILRRDYKEFKVGPYRIGTSAVTWHFRAWAERETAGYQTISEAAWEFALQRQLDMEVIFTAFDHDRDHIKTMKGDYRRELAIFVRTPALMAVKRELENNTDIQLVKNGEFKENDNTKASFYDQGNVKMSRKQVWPLLKQFIEKSLNCIKE